MDEDAGRVPRFVWQTRAGAEKSDHRALPGGVSLFSVGISVALATGLCNLRLDSLLVNADAVGRGQSVVGPQVIR